MGYFVRTKMKPVSTFAFIVFCCQNLLAQDSTKTQMYSLADRETDLFVGISWQGNGDEGRRLWRYYEIGLAKAIYDETEMGKEGAAVYAAEELYLAGNGNVYGTKIGAWAHLIVDLGVAAIYYTDFKKGNFKLRGEAGFGYARTRAVFGYNLPTFGNKSFERLSNHDFEISIQTTFRLHKKLNH